jgi:hypothetical protein
MAQCESQRIVHGTTGTTITTGLLGRVMMVVVDHVDALPSSSTGTTDHHWQYVVVVIFFVGLLMFGCLGQLYPILIVGKVARRRTMGRLTLLLRFIRRRRLLVRVALTRLLFEHVLGPFELSSGGGGRW